MGTAQLVFAVERCGGAIGSDVTGSDVTESDVTGSDVSQVTRSDTIHETCPEVCYAHAQPEVVPNPP